MNQTKPVSIRITDSGFKALKSLEAATEKKRVDIVSEALIHMHAQTVIQPAIKLRLLDPEEILTLQSEIARLEKLHRDKRRRVKIRSSDKEATKKSIDLIGKIDREVDGLEEIGLKLGKLGHLADNITVKDIEKINKLIDWLKRGIQENKLKNPKSIPIFELNLKILTSLFV